MRDIGNFGASAGAAFSMDGVSEWKLYRDHSESMLVVLEDVSAVG